MAIISTRNFPSLCYHSFYTVNFLNITIRCIVGRAITMAQYNNTSKLLELSKPLTSSERFEYFDVLWTLFTQTSSFWNSVFQFLDAQRIHNLTAYLEALHEAQLASEDHTTLLINCFTKLKAVKRLNEFVMVNPRREISTFNVFSVTSLIVSIFRTMIVRFISTWRLRCECVAVRVSSSKLSRWRGSTSNTTAT